MTQASASSSVDSRPRTVVLHQFAGIGDLVWHVPYLRAIAAQSQGGRVALIASPSTFARELLSGEPCVEEVFDFDRRPRRAERRQGRHTGPLGMLRMARELRSHHFDRIVIFSDHVNRAILALCAGIPERIGFGFHWIERRLLSHGPYIRPYRGPCVPVHKNATALALAHGFVTEPVVPKLQLPAEAIAQQAEELAPLPRPLYTFAIGSSEPHKQWGAERFAALATALAQRGCGVVLLGGPAEAGLAQEIVAGIPLPWRSQVLAATGNTVLQSAATLALADANIGNDTGITNLAAALDRPSFVLLGNRPLLDHDPLMRMLLAPEPDIPTRRHAKPPVRLQDISVADVLARLEQDDAPGFAPTPSCPPATALPTALDLRGRDPAEQLALAWWAQLRHRRTGQRFGLLQTPGTPLDLAACFPATFAPLEAAALDSGTWSVWHPGPVWLTASNTFALHPQAGDQPQLPEAVHLQAAAQRASRTGRPRVLVNLPDPTTRQTVVSALVSLGTEALDVSVRHGEDEISSSLLSDMLAADAWVGGCEARDHLWAVLRPGSPQVAMGPETSDEAARWATVQKGLGLPHPWCRWPFNPHLLRVPSTERALLPEALKPLVRQCFPSPATAAIS